MTTRAASEQKLLDSRMIPRKGGHFPECPRPSSACHCDENREYLIEDDFQVASVAAEVRRRVESDPQFMRLRAWVFDRCLMVGRRSYSEDGFGIAAEHGVRVSDELCALKTQHDELWRQVHKELFPGGRPKLSYLPRKFRSAADVRELLEQPHITRSQ